MEKGMEVFLWMDGEDEEEPRALEVEMEERTEKGERGAE